MKIACAIRKRTNNGRSVIEIIEVEW